MPGNSTQQDPYEVSSNDTDEDALSRRNILLGSSALVAAATASTSAMSWSETSALPTA